jgi:GNAT superfamily N-acetyltransferase
MLLEEITKITEGSFTIYPIDAWDIDFYAHQLAALGLEEASKHYLESGVRAPGTDLPADVEAGDAAFAQFCANFGDHPAVRPTRAEMCTGLSELLRLGLQPCIVYVDCDLRSIPLTFFLQQVMQLCPDAHIVGGGFNLSPEVRAAVESVASTAGKQLHVEEGAAWTFSPLYIKETKNAAGAEAPMSAEAAAAAKALAVESSDNEAIAKKNAWLARLMSMLMEEDNVALMRSFLGPPAEPSNELQYINEGQPSDREHLTPLCVAAKKGRLQCLVSLLDEYGAQVNKQCERSLYTAIGLASYEGHTRCVEALLARGADPTLLNKWGESPLSCATKKKRAEIIDILNAHIATMNTVPEGALPNPDSPSVTVLLKNGVTAEIRQVQRSDEPAVIDLYKMSQHTNVTDEATARIHENWTARVLQTDLNGVAENYNTPRTKFWVLTIAKADFDKCSSVPAAPHLVLPDGRVLVGCVAVKPRQDGHANSLAGAWTSKTGELIRLCAHPGIRRCGIGSVLVRHLESWARRAGFDVMMLETTGHMPGAMTLYENLGYVMVSSTEKAYHGDLFQSKLYSKQLS